MKNFEPLFAREELIQMGFRHLGRDVRIYRNVVLSNPSNIEIGDGSQIDDFVHIISSNPVRIGRRVHIGCFCSIAGGGEASFGDYSGLSAGCRIITGSEDFSGEGMTNPCVPIEYRKVTRSYVQIEKHAILGTNSIVFPSVKIHEGATTVSGTIVTKNLESWSLYGGIPARRIRSRPSEKILELEKQLVSKYGY